MGRFKGGGGDGGGGGGGQAECVLQAKAKLTHGYPRERVYTVLRRGSIGRQ